MGKLLLTRRAGQSVMVGQMLLSVGPVSNGCEAVINTVRLKVGDWHLFNDCKVCLEKVNGRYATLSFHADKSLNIVRTELL